MDALLFVVFGVEGYADSDSRIAFNSRRALLAPAPSRTSTTGFIFVFVIGLTSRTSNLGFGAALDNEAALACGDQFLEDLCEGFGYLFEGALNGLVFLRIEMRDQVFNGFMTRIEVRPALSQRLSLSCEILVLLKSLLINMRIFLEALVAFAETCCSLERAIISTKPNRMLG